jgi:hypothetical protein
LTTAITRVPHAARSAVKFCCSAAVSISATARARENKLSIKGPRFCNDTTIFVLWQVQRGIFSQYFAYFEAIIKKGGSFLKVFRLLLFCVLLAACLLGCEGQKGDYFAPFRGYFSAEITGTWQGEEFSARFCREQVGTTVTFYAPRDLCDTVLFKDTEGNIFLSVGDLSLPVKAERAGAYEELLSIFPEKGEVKSVRAENGITHVTGEGFSFALSPDGLPLSAQNAVASVRVSAWEANS